MVKITGVEAITVSSQLLAAVSPDLLSAHRLTVAVDYRDTYRITVFMDVLYDLVREALDGLLPAAPTLTGWQHLTTSLYGRGNSAWASAVHGQAERLEIRNVQLEGEPGAAAFRLLGTADFHGTWAASPGGDYPIVQGTAQATLDQTPGPPGFMTPVGAVWGETRIPLRGIACVGKWLCGPGHLELAAFDSSLALDLNRVYHTIETLFYGDVFRWREFLEGWEVLFSGAVLSVDIHTVNYSLALVPWEAAYQEAIAPYSKLLAYCHKQELDTPTLEPQEVRASHALGRRGALAAPALLAT